MLETLYINYSWGSVTNIHFEKYEKRRSAVFYCIFRITGILFLHLNNVKAMIRVATRNTIAKALMARLGSETGG
jgi:hypothetical protein